MLKNYKREGAPYQLETGERTMFEGIYVASSISTWEIVLSMVEEKVVSS